MLDDALHRIALHVLDDGHLGLLAVLDGEQSVGVTQGQGGLLHRQLHEDRSLTAGVHGGRNQLGDAQTAGSALAELGTSGAFEGNGGSHNRYLLDIRSSVSAHQRAAKTLKECTHTPSRLRKLMLPSPRQQSLSIHIGLTMRVQRRKGAEHTYNRTHRSSCMNRERIHEINESRQQ